MTTLNLPHPPLVATLARTESTAWLEQHGYPVSRSELADFAEHIACLTAAAIHDGARRRVAERRGQVG